MIRSQRRRANLEIGHDAFLDIVANLVGVLIILIVVLGSTSEAMVEQAQQRVRQESQQRQSPARATESQAAALGKFATRAVRAHQDSDRLELLIQQANLEISQRQQQRAALLDLHNQALAAWQQQRNELDQSKVAAARRQSERQAAQQELDQLRGERERLDNLPENLVKLQHLPTPMAKKVYEDRITLRLRSGRVSVVPSQRLMDAAAADFRRAAQTGGTNQKTGIVGPIRDYTVRYSIQLGNNQAQFTGIFQPIHEGIGQTVDDVLAGGSMIDAELAGRDPDSTSVMVWAYDDSFSELRRLKEYLYQRGFATAVRPREMDQPIGASLDGRDPRPQ